MPAWALLKYADLSSLASGWVLLFGWTIASGTTSYAWWTSLFSTPVLLLVDRIYCPVGVS
jgi:hypothetical protein